jgi:hypothetical protein
MGVPFDEKTDPIIKMLARVDWQAFLQREYFYMLQDELAKDENEEFVCTLDESSEI